MANPTYNNPEYFPVDADTKVGLCANVKCDPTYANVMDFESIAQQAEYFNSKRVYDLTDNTYQRTERGFRCNINREFLENAGINYLYYDNVRYEIVNGQKVNPRTKRYYCFVDSLVYINENLTEILFSVDYFQTYFFDLVLLNCFVEREMFDDSVNEEKPGDNIVTESVGYGDYIMKKINSSGNIAEFKSTDFKCVVACSFNRDFTPVSGAAASAGAYNLYGVASGLAYLVFDNIEHGSSNSLSSWLVDCVAQNNINGVQCAYMVPSVLVPKGDIGNKDCIERLPSASQSPIKRGIVSYAFQPTIDGYTPRNKKLLTYPYNMLYLTNNNSESKIYKWEYFRNSISGVIFGLFGSAVFPPECAMVPKDYNNGDKGGYNMWERLVMSDFPMCSFSADPFQMYVAANKWKLGFEVATDLIQTAAVIPGAVGGALKFGKAVGAGLKGAATGGLLRAYRPQDFWGGGNSVSDVLTTAGSWGRQSYRNAGGLSLGQIKDNIMNSDAPDHLSNLASISMSLLDKASLPPKASGQTTNMLNMATNLAGFAAYQCCIRKEYAEILDDYFDMFGYACHKVKQPSINSRPLWNYVKTLNCLVRPTAGNHMVPNDAMVAFQSIFDNGVTIWHVGKNQNNDSIYGDYVDTNHTHHNG